MRTKILLIIFIVLCQIAQSQDERNIPKLNIDLSSAERKVVRPIEPGAYDVYFININPKATYDYSIELKNISINKLKTPKDFQPSTALNDISISLGKFSINKGQQLIIKITETFQVKKEGENNLETKTKKFEYTFNTPRRGEWRTTFGFNFIYKINQDTYFASDNDNGTYTITEVQNRDKMDFHPTLMFTWLSNNPIDEKNRNWHFGLSGGLGYDFDESLSVFAGPSLIYNENITFTIGIALHNQKRLTSNYSPDDIISEPLINYTQIT